LTRYSIYGNRTFQELFPEEKLKGALIYKSTWFASAYIENQGGTGFTLKALPTEAQFSPMFGAVTTDFDNDGNLDLVAVGNSFSTEPLTGFYDAGIGTCLKGDGNGNFVSVSVSNSGFFVDKDAKGLTQIKLASGKMALIATANRDSVKVFEPIGYRTAKIIKLLRDDAFAEITLASGKIRRQEFYYGSSYLSQASRVLEIPQQAKAVYIIKINGSRRSYIP
jgi:hypothetical protein